MPSAHAWGRPHLQRVAELTMQRDRETSERIDLEETTHRMKVGWPFWAFPSHHAAPTLLPLFCHCPLPS